ncbi:hypothetical protein EJ05DRAFT_335142 [Pseudovirgaria hyperparasitica]|uniref:Uncharacterized protein n=1 Tax=Pseudovirgaria hyperparasitica TaxID=470096 RepID=A0A6A6WAV1_9PEZI|nr:uncharacterized protein EJ05DRAFT_335142 [Pseudovirgaria hyperparasitica]KAF2759164.1 hypothetical protein EJ05DRAFT_335142 [Pseudovirgaria hyperparasitica]
MAYRLITHIDGLYLSPSRAPKYDPPCPFHLLASIYLDGRHKPERRTIVYLDPAHKHYNDGPTYMRSRWVKHEDGIIKSHKWVFKDAVGIETMLDKMIIAGELPIQGSLDKDQDDLVAALNASTIQAGTRDEDCRDSSVGSIMITVQRVTVGNIKTEKHYQPSHTLKDKEDVDMDGASSHIAKPTEEGDVVSGLQESVQVIEYSPYTLDEEDMYATFKFLYRSKGESTFYPMHRLHR